MYRDDHLELFVILQARGPTPVFLGFPRGSAGKEPARKAGDLGSIAGLAEGPWGGDPGAHEVLLWALAPGVWGVGLEPRIPVALLWTRRRTVGQGRPCGAGRQ